MRRLTYGIAAALLVALGLALYFYLLSPVTTVILVRHAERLNQSDTTSISAEGLARANTLAHVVGPARIDIIYVSDKVRTQQTAGPTATLLGLTPIPIPAGEVDRIVDSVKAHAGSVILLVGHSDTIPQIIDGLGISPVPTINANEFDHLLIITLNRMRATMTHLKYGIPT